MLKCLFPQRFFSHRAQSDDSQHGLNHDKYMVTDNAVYIGETLLTLQSLHFALHNTKFGESACFCLELLKHRDSGFLVASLDLFLIRAQTFWVTADVW